MNKQSKKVLNFLNLSESTVSTVLGALVVVIVGVLIFNYFKQSGIPAEEITPEAVSEEEIVFEETEEGEIIPVNLPEKHLVAVGEDLWKISEKYYDSGYN